MRVKLGRTALAGAVIAAAATLALDGTSAPPASALGASTPHLAIVMLENKEFTQVVGNSNAPYINSTLIPSGRLFTSYNAATHPSLPNYLVLTSGQYDGCVTDTCTPNTLHVANVFSQMNSAVPAVTWKVYAEGMPSACYTKNYGSYAVRHNPPTFYTNLAKGTGDGTCVTNDVPYARLQSDISANALPRFMEVIPNLYDDMHSDRQAAPCNLGSAVQDEVCQGDTWLQNNLPALLSDGGRHDVTVLVMFDEGSSGQGGGGRVMLLEAGPTTCAGCTESRPYNEYGIAAAVDDWFGLPALTAPAPGL